jgi:hypothetical protein
LRGRLNLIESDPRKALREIKKAEGYFLEDGRELELAAARVWHIGASLQSGSRADVPAILEELSGNKGQFLHTVLVAARNQREEVKGSGVKTASAPYSCSRRNFTTSSCSSPTTPILFCLQNLSLPKT